MLPCSPAAPGSSSRNAFAMPWAAEGALLELRAFVKGRGLSFTEPSVLAGWAALPVKRCVLGNFETKGLNLKGDLRAER
jgi:hypothetical protein